MPTLPEKLAPSDRIAFSSAREAWTGRAAGGALGRWIGAAAGGSGVGERGTGAGVRGWLRGGCDRGGCARGDSVRGAWLRGGGTIAEAQAPSANSPMMPVDLVTNALIREYKS